MKKTGYYTKALPLYEELLITSENMLNKTHDNYGILLNSLTRFCQVIKDYKKALSLITKSAHFFKSQLKQSKFFGSSYQGHFLNTFSYYFEIHQSFQLIHPNIELSKVILENNIEVKGIGLNNQQKLLNKLRNNNDATLNITFQQWQKNKQVLKQQYTLPKSNRIANFDQLLENTNELENRLALSLPEFAKAQNPIDWKIIQDNLQQNEALIEFSHFDFHDGTEWTDSTFYIAYILRPGYDAPRVVQLFEEKELQAITGTTLETENKNRINKLYQRGVEPDDDGVVPDEDELKNLYALIWQPLDSFLTDANTIYYSPSGMLHQIALPALSMHKKKEFNHQYELHHLGSSRKLMFSSESEQRESIQTISLFGGIDYDLETKSNNLTEADIISSVALSNKPTSSRSSFNPLAGTKTEVDAIQSILEKNGKDTKSFQATQATEEAFYNLCTGERSPDILHIATHGFFFPDPKTNPTDFNAAEERPYVLAEDPLIRSGLALTGANQAWQGKPIPTGKEDGILTAYEIAQQDLSNTKLVVLSACETDLGDIKGAEGVYGLQRAFKLAGVDKIIMSLWQVSDEATKGFMVQFYTNWLEKEMSIHDAFYTTQEEMQLKYKTPYFWAGFILME